jgi:hypothetical protein
MKRSTTSAIAVVLVAALVLVGTVAVVGLATNGANAIEVGDQKVSRESVNDELRAIAENDKLVKSQGPGQVTRTEGSVASNVATGSVLTAAVQEALIKEYLDRKDERITAADRAEGKRVFSQTLFGQVASDFPQWYVERWHERLAAYVALTRVAGVDLQSDTAADDIASVLRPVARRVGVTIDPRYGRFVLKGADVEQYELPAGLLPANANN